MSPRPGAYDAAARRANVLNEAMLPEGLLAALSPESQLTGTQPWGRCREDESQIHVDLGADDKFTVGATWLEDSSRKESSAELIRSRAGIGPSYYDPTTACVLCAS